MVDAPMMDPARVRELAIAGRVDRDPRYHAREHHLRFLDVVDALRRCWRVQRDARKRPDGSPLHPSGYLAWCRWRPNQNLRVDFNLHVDEDGEWILVVTAFEVT